MHNTQKTEYKSTKLENFTGVGGVYSSHVYVCCESVMECSSSQSLRSLSGPVPDSDSADSLSINY